MHDIKYEILTLISPWRL